MVEKVLITGGAGFIGCHTAKKLINEGYDVRILDNLNKQVHPDHKVSLSKLHPSVDFICGDVRDWSTVESALDGIDVVYHFAAETGVGQSMYEIQRYSSINIQGTAVLCDCIARGNNHVKKVILSSSRAVYGEGEYKCEACGTVYPETRTRKQLKRGNWNPLCPDCSAKITPLPCREIMPCRQVSIYGFTKKVQEDMLSIFSNTYKVPLVILRYCNVFGPGQSVSNPYVGVLSIFSSLMLSNKSIEIYEDGQMQRDFIAINDVVNANLKALELEQLGMLVLNIGSGVPRTILELAKFLKQEIGSRSEFIFSGRYRIGDIRHSYANMSKTNDLMEKPPNDSFETGIKDLVAWARNEDKNVALEHSIDELSNFGLTGIVE